MARRVGSERLATPGADLADLRLGILLQNLTLMAPGILISFVFLNVVRLIAAIGVLAAGTLIVNFNYFYDRLNPTSGTANLS